MIEQYEGWEHLEIDPKVFELETVYRALYCMLDKAYFMLRTLDNGNFIVYIKKRNVSFELISEELSNELIKFKELNRRELSAKELEKAIMTDIIFPKEVAQDSDDIRDIDFNKLEAELEDELKSGQGKIPIDMPMKK